YSEGPNPYLIANGFPTATGFTLTINGVGDPIEASGPDGSLYAGGVLAHTTSPGPPPFNFTVPQGAIAVARSANSGRSFGPISAVFSDQELQGMVSRGMNPKGIPALGVNPFDRPWIAADQSTGAVYVSTTAHPQRYVTVSHDKARTWGRIEALDCDEVTPPNADHDVTCGSSRGACARVRAPRRRRPPPPPPPPLPPARPAPSPLPRASHRTQGWGGPPRPPPYCRCRLTGHIGHLRRRRPIAPRPLRGPAPTRESSIGRPRGPSCVEERPPTNPSRHDQQLGPHMVNADNAGQRVCPTHHQPPLDRIWAYRRAGCRVAQCLPALQPKILLDARHPECVRRNLA